MKIAFHEIQLKVWPFKGIVGIKEVHPFDGWYQIHLIYNWCHLGTVNSEDQLMELLESQSLDTISFDLDSYRLLTKAILSPKFRLPVIEVSAVSRQA